MDQETQLFNSSFYIINHYSSTELLINLNNSTASLMVWFSKQNPYNSAYMVFGSKVLSLIRFLIKAATNLTYLDYYYYYYYLFFISYTFNSSHDSKHLIINIFKNCSGIFIDLLKWFTISNVYKLILNYINYSKYLIFNYIYLLYNINSLKMWFNYNFTY